MYRYNEGIQVYRYAGLQQQVYRYTGIQVYKYKGMYRYVGKQVPGYTGMPGCSNRYVKTCGQTGVQVRKYTDIHL